MQNINSTKIAFAASHVIPTRPILKDLKLHLEYESVGRCPNGTKEK